MPKLWNANIHYHGIVHASLPAGATHVLDVGCGDGILAAELARSGVPRVVAIDVDEAVLGRARARHADLSITWLRCDALDAPFTDESFDAVVSIGTLHHMDARRALERFAQLTRPDGVVVVVGLADITWRDMPLAALGLIASTLLGMIHGKWEHSAPMCWPPPLTYAEMKSLSATVLPGSRYRRHLLSRYSIVWKKPAVGNARPGPSRRVDSPANLSSDLVK